MRDLEDALDDISACRSKDHSPTSRRRTSVEGQERANDGSVEKRHSAQVDEEMTIHVDQPSQRAFDARLVDEVELTREAHDRHFRSAVDVLVHAPVLITVEIARPVAVRTLTERDNARLLAHGTR